MRNIKSYLVLLLLSLSIGGCVKPTIEPNDHHTGIPIFIKTDSRETPSIFSFRDELESRIDTSSIYVLLFSPSPGDQDICLQYQKVFYDRKTLRVKLNLPVNGCHMVIVANAGTELENLLQDYNPLTLKDLRQRLSMPDWSLNPSGMPTMPCPMSLEFAYDPSNADYGKTIGSPTSPLVLLRATVKLTVAYTAEDEPFELLGANLIYAPVQGLIMPNTIDDVAFSTAHYGYNGNVSEMIVQLDPLRPDTKVQETAPLYAYESPVSNHTSVLIKGKYQGVVAYYRINLLTDDKKEPMPLLRNYYYRIIIGSVGKAGYSTAQEAIDNPPENELKVTIEVRDPFSHEIITKENNFLGLSNSEFWIYDSYVMNEFNCLSVIIYTTGGATTNYESIQWGNGFVATTLTYTSKLEWGHGRVSGTNGIRFRMSDTKWDTILNELVLNPAVDVPITRDIIISVPHDFVEGKVLIEIGPLSRTLDVKRRDAISVMGDVINLGPGFTSAQVDFSTEFFPLQQRGPAGFKPQIQDPVPVPFVRFATNSSVNTQGRPTLNLSATQNLFVHVKPSANLPDLRVRQNGRTKYGLSEFYLTRKDQQKRVKVHLLREGFGNDLLDNTPEAGLSYTNAFWRNDQTGERLIILSYIQYVSARWSARVIYGSDFIRLAKSHRVLSTSEIRASDAEMFQADASWGTSVQCDFLSDAEEKQYRVYNPPNFRVALTSPNLSGKPRYGLILVQVPSADGSPSGSTYSYWVYVRQGEEADYVYRPFDQILGNTCTYARQISPYNLSVADPDDHPGGNDYSNHKIISQAVFTDYPSQIGFLFEHGRNRAIHPTNPPSNEMPIGSSYDINEPYIDICPDQYELPTLDFDANIGYNGPNPYTNTFVHSLGIRSVGVGSRSYCADGYCDRMYYPERNDKLAFEYQKPAWMQSTVSISDLDIEKLGPRAANSGQYYVNPATLAGVFIPSAPYREAPTVNSKAASSLRFKDYYWGRLVTQTDQTKEAVFYVTQTSLQRSWALPIRCVKK